MIYAEETLDAFHQIMVRTNQLPLKFVKDVQNIKLLTLFQMKYLHNAILNNIQLMHLIIPQLFIHAGPDCQIGTRSTFLPSKILKESADAC